MLITIIINLRRVRDHNILVKISPKFVIRRAPAPAETGSEVSRTSAETITKSAGGLGLRLQISDGPGVWRKVWPAASINILPFSMGGQYPPGPG